MPTRAEILGDAAAQQSAAAGQDDFHTDIQADICGTDSHSRNRPGGVEKNFPKHARPPHLESRGCRPNS
jgi:hypothetical protein